MKKLIIILLIGISIISCNKKEYSFDSGSYPIESAKDIPIIRATVKGESFYFLLDTGATISVFDSTVFNEKFSEDFKTYKTETNIIGYGGELKSVTTLSKSFGVNAGGVIFNEKWNIQDLRSIRKRIKEGTGYYISGIIGNNNLYKRNITIDLGNKELRVSK